MRKIEFLRFYILMLTSVFTLAAFGQQERMIRGVVTDKLGEPLPGVTITIKGTTTGTITDVDGNYSFQVPGDAVLVFTFIGMETQEVAVQNRTQINITMEESVIGLDEVVAIGYSTITKRDLTGSVASVSGKTISQMPVTNVSQALSGRLAGVHITTADGSPDAEMIVRVRGGGSITGDNSPLYIVDGFPVSSINDVAPGDIESIDVLKDASSTAIYGSQGANGVVIITTKSAKGGKTDVSYNGFIQTKRLARRLDVLDSYEYTMLNYELAAIRGEDYLNGFQNKFGVYDDLELYKYQKGSDWQDDMFGADVISQQHNLSVTGGNEKTKYALSSTWNYDGGLMDNNDYERYNVNFKLTHKILDNLKFDVNARVSDATINGSGTSGGTYKVRTSEAVTKGPVNGLDDFIEVNPNTLSDDEYEQWLRSNLTLSERASQYWKRKFRKSFYFSGSLTWDILENLTYRIDGGYRYGFDETQNYWGEYTSNASYVGGEPLVDWTKANARKLRQAQTLNYKFKVGSNNRFNFLIGQEFITNKGGNSYIYATNYSADLMPERIFANMGLSDGTIKISSAVNDEDNMASFFGRFGYNYRDRYLLTLTARADGSSKFPEKNHWGFFPAAALAWRISEEPFMEGMSSWLSHLKLRVSYGEAGNNRIKSAMYKQEYRINTSKAYGIGDRLTGYYEARNRQLANPDLKWETTITRNAGLDFGLWNGRMSGTVEAYWNSAEDLLIEREIVAPGYETTIENVGETSNKGIEFSMDAFIFERHDFSLSANFNIGFYRTNVENLAEGIEEQSYASGWAGTDLKGYYDYRVRVGEPVGLIYGWVTDGYYTTNDFESYDEATGQYILKEGIPTTGLYGGAIGIRPGTLKLKDMQSPGEEGYGVIDDNDRTIIGDTNPDFYGGFGLNATYKGIDLSVLFNFVYGNDIYNANKLASTQQYRTNYPNMLDMMHVDNRYTYLDRNTGEIVTDLETLRQMNEGENAKALWSPFTFGNSTTLPHSWAIEDGSFLRLQNITLGYTLPQRISSLIACKQFRVFGTINNAWLWTNYTGYDPEVNSPVRSSSTSGLTPGVDYSSYPKSLSWTFGVNIKF
ncbi:SusC/RagA family TonB-linked outer membrane protein [Thermophagus sp. OGC60D27]|uniref:SusC/RagA family TonB-linked outer membrane protein n=1 Tax=Thermophagus sp. OGC60D27 TaxID=3458415 RepID=UPI00403809C3